MMGDRARMELAGSRFANITSLVSVDSTNRHLLELARTGAPDGTVVVADHQEQGRGRMGRSWVAPAGTAVLVSALLRDLAGGQAQRVGMVMGLAVLDASQDVAGVSAWLKWPNDVTDGRRKLAGILAETDLDGPRVRGVVVGAGVNVTWPSPGGWSGEADQAGAGGSPGVSQSPGPAASLSAATAVSLSHLAGHPVDREALLVALLRSLEHRAAGLATAAGRRAQALEYRRRCATLGQVVRVELVGEAFGGTAVDVTSEGHLLVDTGVCLRSVSAGDVVHLRPVPPG